MLSEYFAWVSQEASIAEADANLEHMAFGPAAKYLN